MKSHLLEYLDQHRRLEESVTPKKNEKSDVKSRLQVITVIITFPLYFLLLQEFVLQKKQRENLSSQSQEEMGEVPEAEATDAEVFSPPIKTSFPNGNPIHQCLPLTCKLLLPGLTPAQLHLVLQGPASDLPGARGRDRAKEAQPLKPLA